ncbi:MAG: TlpA family protein disulfide reductase [Gemmataceae bacterium]|nr:TlpA family protein disulfide reductase [Gemmataceae bacterium]
MGQPHIRIKLSAAVLAWAAGSTAFAAGPAPADMLQFQPKQPGVVCATPTAAEAASYKVELVNGPGGASGWALRDGRGQLVRKFVASKGAKASIDIWSYYLDGQEVYREQDTTGTKKANEFRWYGINGMRWGVDINGDGKIDGWKMISAEEVSQELLKAVITKDTARFQALLINDAELKALELGQSETDKIRQGVAGATAKFTQAVQGLSALNEKTQWLQLEAQAPNCIPADALGGKTDLVKYRNASLLYENAGKHDWITLGEVVQVGRAWRLVGGPTPGHGEAEIAGNNGGSTTTGQLSVPDAVKPLITKLQQIDAAAPKPGAPQADIAKHAMERAAVVEQIAAGVTGKDQEQWIKQLADSLVSAAQNSGPDQKAPLIRLTGLREQLVKLAPGTPLTAYVAFREASAEYAGKLAIAKGAEMQKVQDGWREKLKEFVTTYPTSEDAPDAALNVAMISEFSGKEAEAKNWYNTIVTKYGQHPYAAKAAGALKRLDLEGQPFELAGNTFNGQAFNIRQLQGKVVVVYYWASWNGTANSDFVRLAALLKELNGKGVELVTVNLDNNAGAAMSTLQKAQVNGAHISDTAGLDGPLATQYGITVLPNLFIVGKDGKVASRTAQINTLEDDIKKLTEK